MLRCRRGQTAISCCSVRSYFPQQAEFFGGGGSAAGGVSLEGTAAEWGGHGRRSRGASSLDCDAGFGVQRLNWEHRRRNWSATGEIGKQRAGSPIVHAARHKETGGLFPKYGQDDPAGPLPDEALPFQPCPVKFAVRGHSPISMSRTSEPSTTNRKAVRTLWMP